MKNNSNEQNPMETRYRRARALEHMESQPMVKNASIYPHWIANSNRFWYTRQSKSGTEYRLVDAEAATNLPAFDHAKLATALARATGENVSATDLPISNLDFSDSSSVRFDAFDKRWLFKNDSDLREDTPTFPAHWLISPDGGKALFLKEHNLWLRDLTSGVEWALTTDGVQHHGYATQPEGRDLVGGLDGQPAPVTIPEAMWSPDGRKLFTVQLDERYVGTLPSILYVPQDGTVRPRMVERKYSLPGDEHIAEYRFLVIDVATGEQTSADYTPVEDSFIWLGVFSGNRAWWSGDSQHTYFLDMARGQKSVRVVEIQVETGKTRVLFEESADTYLEIGHRFEAPTTLIPIPGEVLIQAMGRNENRDFYYREIAWVHVDSGEMTLIASSDHDYDMHNDHGGLGGRSPDGSYLVSTHSRLDTVPVTDLRDRNGSVILVLETADVSGLPEGWQWPEPVKTIAADGKTPIYGAVFRPTDFDPSKKYPVLDFGPALPFYAITPKQAFSLYNGVAAAFAELGMIVVMMDGRGTVHRSKAFRDYGYDDFLENAGVIDRMTGIKQLAERYSYMDLDRVGILDFDGSNAGVIGLLAFPEFYRVGVASSLYDPRLVKQGEVYMGLTTEEKRNNAVTWGETVKNLKGKLLITTGLLDQYFHPSATFQLTDALLKANKDFDHLVQPNGAHAWRLVNARRRMWDHLTRHLIGKKPPADFELKTGWEVAYSFQMTESTSKDRG